MLLRNLIAAALFCASAAHAQKVDASTLNGKVLLGYQGWFDCPREGSPGWSHWLRHAPDQPVVDLYPDLSEFDKADLCAVPGLTIAGKQAYLYSAWNPHVVDRHFQWMQANGLDGVLVQRFVSDIPRRRRTGDVVLKNIIAAAKAHGRVFAIEYDVSGANPKTVGQQLMDDWQYLVSDLKITSEPTYQRHNGKPVVSVWGMGFLDNHPPDSPTEAKRIIGWFKEQGVTYMGGVPSRWRTLGADSRKDEGWHEVYAMMDIIQPWTVGRYSNEAGADRWKDEVIVGDIAKHPAYMPVVFPGFSWHNLKHDAKENAIPRNGGKFLWRQAVNARQAGATMLKIAMFDEVNEGTAVMKAVSKRSEAPEQSFWLALDADGLDLPSDYYLRLSGAITRVFHGKAPANAEMPKLVAGGGSR
jgi:hypothetical protein